MKGCGSAAERILQETEGLGFPRGSASLAEFIGPKASNPEVQGLSDYLKKLFSL